ncbi:MAG: aminoglycoside phosphotransferase family protein [Cyclobacteriaceae bacterium]|nr:aminoglycoside phosphotransferase family protein [Cyclobacteriaceae bacterium SS2]
MDIENPQILSNYLFKHDLISEGESLSCKMLTGGVSAKTVYVEKSKPIVIKQALQQLKTKSEWFSDPARILIENLGLKWLYDHLPPGSIPQPIFCDEKNHLLIMEAISPPAKNLKELLLAGVIEKDYIKSFGALLGTIHMKSLNDPDASKTFHNRDYFINLRIEPYYEHTSHKLTQFQTFYADLIESTLETQLTIVHGDYSPKNVLIKDGRLILLDHEVMHFGDPAFDVGFSITHFLSKANHLNNPAYVDAARLSWDSYRSIFNYERDNFEQRCVKHLLGCMLARVHGKSPLEYFAADEHKWQYETVSSLINEMPSTLTQLFESYKNLLYERKN